MQGVSASKTVSEEQVLKALINFIRNPKLHQINIDGEDRLTLHRIALSKKPMLQSVFAEFHHLFRRLDEKFLSSEGLRIEIGAGVAPMKATYSDVVSTDLVKNPSLDFELDAQAMTLSDASTRVFYLQNSFHHFSDPSLFFSELQRVLNPGGGVIILDPYFGPFASYLYKRLFRTEGFDKNFPSWSVPSDGPMNGANQALSFIVFIRDRLIFETHFPELEIVYEAPVGNYLTYLFSGGLNFRQLWPTRLSFVLRFIQKLLSPFIRVFALHHVVVIRKRQSQLVV